MHLDRTGCTRIVAIESGFRIAMGALAAGAAAERAVEIAADLDENTRRPLTMLTLIMTASSREASE